VTRKILKAVRALWSDYIRLARGVDVTAAGGDASA
jgi:hypothetical protein